MTFPLRREEPLHYTACYSMENFRQVRREFDPFAGHCRDRTHPRQLKPPFLDLKSLYDRGLSGEKENTADGAIAKEIVIWGHEDLVPNLYPGRRCEKRCGCGSRVGALGEIAELLDAPYTGARAEAAYCQAPLLTQTFCWSGSVGWHCGMHKPAIESLFELVDGNDTGAAYVFSSDPEADVHWTFVVTHEDEHRYLFKKIG